MVPILRRTGRRLAQYLSRPSPVYRPLATSDFSQLARMIQPGDVLLVEGNTRVSTAIKYLTQSTWSHAALCVGPSRAVPGDSQDPTLLEADLLEGVSLVPLSKYADFHTRICRPMGLAAQDLEQVIRFALGRVGWGYDLKNLIDLARYLLPVPPVPVRWRRKMLALGSGDPTRAICSSLIAQAFQAVRYPILPAVVRRPAPKPGCDVCYDEVFHIRHHRLFAPRDFDISPYFQIVKPALESNFDYRGVSWNEPEKESALAV